MISTFKAQKQSRRRKSTWEKFSEGLKRDIETLRIQYEASTKAISDVIDSLREFQSFQQTSNITLENMGFTLNEMDDHHRRELTRPHVAVPEETKEQYAEDPRRHCATTPHQKFPEPCKRLDDLVGRKRKASEQVSSSQSCFSNEIDAESLDVKPDLELIEEQNGPNDRR